MVITTKDIFDMNYKAVIDKLLCPVCFQELSVLSILENSTVSWPYQNWIYLICPKCNNHSHVEISNNLIKTGQLDGAPGPCFICCSMIKLNDLFVDAKQNKLICEYNEMKYEFPAKK